MLADRTPVLTCLCGQQAPHEPAGELAHVDIASRPRATHLRFEPKDCEGQRDTSVDAVRGRKRPWDNFALPQHEVTQGAPRTSAFF